MCSNISLFEASEISSTNFHPVMPKRFVNVEYSGTKTRINVTEFEDLSEVQDAVKAKFGPAMADVGAPQIQIQDQQGQQINMWALFNSLPQGYFAEGGPCLAIRILPPPPRASRNEGLTTL